MLQQARARKTGRLRHRRGRRGDPRPARRPRRCSTASRPARAQRLEYGASRSRRWTSTPSSPAARRSSLVDELAHTNAPGSRHPKRYLDVEELLNRGIDVYTTVNIQHIESLNDVVAQITHVRVRETVPDSVFDRADAIELVDLTPDDLIERLKEGKVYVPKQAERALEHYFSPGNLTALRELALRRTAERVDEQLLTHMQAHAIPGPWAAGERILVCVSEDPRAAGLVRYAKRLADRLHAPLTRALRRDAAQPAARTRKSATGVADTLRLAEALGGEAITIPGGDRSIADDVIRFAQANNVTHIIIGKSTRLALVRDPARLGGPRAGPAVRQHQRPCHRGRRARRAIRSPRKRCARPQSAPLRPWPYVVTARWPRLPPPSASAMLIQPLLGVENVDLVFLTAVVGVAVRYGLWPSLLATVASSLCYNFFFLPPIYTFTITDPTNVAAVRVLHHGGGRGLAMLPRAGAPRRWPRTSACARWSCSMPSAASWPGSAPSMTCSGRRPTRPPLMLKVRVVLLLPEDGSIVGQGRLSAGGLCSTRRMSPRPKWAWQNNRPAGPRLGHARRVRNACSCRCERAAALSASWASTATSRAAPHARSAPPARRA